MNRKINLLTIALICVSILPQAGFSQIGKRFPSERKVVADPVTGTMLTFLTSTEVGDSKIYQTHSQWTADGEWLIFRSNRAKNEAIAVNEISGEMVQVTEGGYNGMLCIARKSMKLYFMRNASADTSLRRNMPLQVMEVDLGAVFTDSKNAAMKPASAYQRICGTISGDYSAGGDMALDADEDFVYFRIGREEAGKHLPENAKIESTFGPRKMGAGPAGLMSMNLQTGKLKYIVSVPFQIGHVQTNPWVPGEIVFCWETGGKAPQRTWTVMADGTGLRPLYPESIYEWVTHEAVITKDETAIAIMGHRKIDIRAIPGDTTHTITPDQHNPGQEAAWGPSGTREKPTGLGIVNMRTREMVIIAQTPEGSGLWHVNGSPDGRWAVGDDFKRNIYLIDRKTHEMILLSAGHKETAADHPHPTFSADSKKIEIESAMLSADNRSMNICIIPVPKEWLKRYK